MPTECGVGKYVDPLIGTGDVGYRLGAVAMGAMAPFGMMKVQPDTSDTFYGKSPVAHCTGYWYPDNAIDGFPHTHLHGTGAPGYGDILVTAVVGMNDERTVTEAYRSKFDHATEVARAGYYKVSLATWGVDVELTATMRAALHRYHFPASAISTVLVDASYSLPGCGCEVAEVHVDPQEMAVYGYKKAIGGMSGRFGGHTVYFWGKLRRDFSSFGTFEAGQLHPEQQEQKGATADRKSVV